MSVWPRLSLIALAKFSCQPPLHRADVVTVDVVVVDDFVVVVVVVAVGVVSVSSTAVLVLVVVVVAAAAAGCFGGSVEVVLLS